MDNKYILPTLGLIISSLILSFGFGKIKAKNNYVTVKGLSEREVMADKAWWGINAQISANSVEEIQNRVSKVESQIKSFLKNQGFTEEETNVEGFNIYENNYQGAVSKYNANINLSVSTSDIEKVKKGSKSVGDLIAKGILIQADKWASGPKYYYTKFKEIKKEMLAEATKEAKAAAQEFANNSGSNVGKIRRANQGVFQILPGNQMQEDQVFFSDKIIRVVSTFDYYLN